MKDLPLFEITKAGRIAQLSKLTGHPGPPTQLWARRPAVLVDLGNQPWQIANSGSLIAVVLK